MKPSEHAVSSTDAHRDETFEHRLEQFNPGVVWLDVQGRVSALNEVALQILGPAGEHSLGVDQDKLFGLDIVQLHPAKSRDKLRFLLQSSGSADGPEKSAPPVAMVINIPDRMLMIKVSRMSDLNGPRGICMIFYDLTDLTTQPATEALSGTPAPPRRLFKIPVYRKNRVILIDVKDIVRFQGDGHYTTITTKDDRYLSNLSLADLELRLDSSTFLRVHRSHIVNLQCAVELVKADENLSLVMDDVERSVVPVSRSHSAQLKELLGVI